jgi:GT2 family glycosyltransferase
MISVVIPNFNSGHLLVKNLPPLFELLKKSKLEYEVIVTDDASTDNSVSLLRSHLGNQGETFSIVTNPVNTGFGSNVDRGIRAARGEFIFVLNATDILPEKSDYFSLMLRHFQDPKVFSVGAAKQEERAHGQGIILFHRGLFQHFHNFEDYKAWLQTMRSTRISVPHAPYFPNSPDFPNRLVSAWSDGGSQAMKKEYYLKIGGFDPVYKFYWEDVDLGYRAWQAGFEVHYEPKALLVHHKAEGPIAKYYSDDQRRVMNLRNQFIFTWKNGSWSQRLQNVAWWPYHFLVTLKNRDWLFFVAFWQALTAYVSRHPNH